MKFRLAALLLAASACAYGQGVRYESNVVTSASNVPTGSQSTLYTVPGARITVCAYPATGAPCSNTVPIYSNQALTQAISGSHMTADAHGRFGFWITPGTYTYSVVNPANGSLLATPVFTVGGAGSGSGGGGGGTTGGTWNSAITYTPGSVVKYAGQTYLALQSSTNIIPNSSVDFWSPIAGGGITPTTAGIPVWGGTNYSGAKTPPAGTIVGTSDAQTLSNKTFSDQIAAPSIATNGNTPGTITLGPATGSTPAVVVANDGAGNAMLTEGTASASRLCTATNGACPAGTAANPAGSAGYVQFNGGSSFGGSPYMLFNNTTKDLYIGGTTAFDNIDNCYNAGLDDGTCNWEHLHFMGGTKVNGAETRAPHGGDYFFSGPSAYSGFPSGAFNAFNSGGEIVHHIGGQFRGDGFKRYLDSSLGEHLNFVGKGDWSVEDWEVNYGNSFCCGADEGGTAFRYQLKEFGGYLNTTLTSFTNTATTAPDAAGQGPYSSSTHAVVLSLADGNGNGPGISTGGRIVDLASVNASCLDPATTFSGASPYFYGTACGTFTGTVAGDGTMETALEPGAFVGKIGVTVAHGSITPTVAYGVTTAAIGDQTNRYTSNIGVAQSIPITIHGGTAGQFSTGYACIAGTSIETVPVTAVGSLSGGTQTITANVRSFHMAASWVFSGPCRSLILHDDASNLNPYPYTVFGYVSGNLVVGVQKGGGVNFGDIFRRGSKPAAYGATWSVLNSAEIIADDTVEETPPTYQVEDAGITYTNGDKILGLTFPSRRDNMFAFRDLTTNASDQSVKSGLMEESFGGPALNAVGAISLGYEPDVETNLVQCSATTYIRCGGWADPPNYAKEINGMFGNIFKVPQPNKSTYGDASAAIMRITPGAGADFNNTYSLFNFTVGGAEGAGRMDYNSGTGDYYLGSPSNSGFYQSYIGKIGFADVDNPAHTPLGALSVDIGTHTWQLGDGLALHNTNYNLALQYLTAVEVNGAAITNTGSATTYLDGTGHYSTPAGSGGAVVHPWSCQPGFGDGTNALTSPGSAIAACFNDTGATVTLTGIKCFVDAGASTVAMTNSTGTALLSSTLTCSSSVATGTQSGTVALGAGDWIKLTVTADGTSKQLTPIITGTHP